MKCPFVSAVGKGLFQRSNLTLSSAISHCPFIRQTRAAHQSIPEDAGSNNPLCDTVKNAIRKIPALPSCPYTRGEEAPGPKCPITGIDVSRVVHSEVLLHIHDETPTLIPEYKPVLPKPDHSSQMREQIKKHLQAKKEDGTYRKFKVVNKDAQRTPIGDKVTPYKAFGEPQEIYCANDYLNMSRHPKVIEANNKAAETHGVGAGGTRNISGTSELTTALEMEIRDWHKTEDALVFNGCYPANVGTLSTLLGKHFPGAQCFSDRGNHRSMIEGMQKGRREQLDPRGKIFPFEHDNPDHLEKLLRAEHMKNPNAMRIVAFESVHSMGGNIQKVEELCDIAHHYGALTFCDEVHAIGLYGRTGAGIAEKHNIQDKIDILSGTLGKGVGGFGGYIASSSDFVDMVRQNSPEFIFTTAMPPPTLASNIASIRILKSAEGEYFRRRHWQAVHKLRRELDNLEIPYKKPNIPSHVTSVELPSTDLVDRIERKMADAGYYVQAIKYPTVPKGEEMLRITVSPLHLRYKSTIPRFARALSATINAN